MIIFLDVDGVLNHKAILVTHNALDDNCVRRLAALVRATDATVVVTSSWRFLPSLVETLRAKLVEFGVSIHSVTDTAGPTRGHEIGRWLKDRPQLENVRILILDDDSDFLPEQMPFLVRTSMATGLTDAHLDQAAKLLGVSLS